MSLARTVTLTRFELSEERWKNVIALMVFHQLRYFPHSYSKALAAPTNIRKHAIICGWTASTKSQRDCKLKGLESRVRSQDQAHEGLASDPLNPSNFSESFWYLLSPAFFSENKTCLNERSPLNQNVAVFNWAVFEIHSSFHSWLVFRDASIGLSPIYEG